MKIMIIFLFIVILPQLHAQSFALNTLDGKMSLGAHDPRDLGSISTNDIDLAYREIFLRKPFPSTEEFSSAFRTLIEKECLGAWREKSCLKKKELGVIDYLRSSGKIDNQAWLILRAKSETLPDLSSYLKDLKKFSDLRLERQGEHSDSDISSLYTRELSVKSNGFKGVTPRQYLYFNYSSTQIIWLSSIANKMVRVMNSKNAVINIELEDDEDLEITLSYSEKYRLGVKLAWMEIEKAVHQRGFKKRPRMLDVLMAGIETGVFGPEALKELIAHPRLMDGFRNKKKNYIKILKSVGKAALYNTPVIGQFAAIPILIWETFQNMEEARDAQSRSTHLF